MKVRQFLAATAFAAAISGCTILDGGAIATGSPRESIAPEQVKIYRNAPDKFVEIAVVYASAGHDFLTNSKLLDAALSRLKEEAAKLGANGVILTEIHERNSPSITMSYGAATATSGGSSAYATGSGISINRGDAYTRVTGVAVYVP